MQKFQFQKEHKEKCREFNQLKRESGKVAEERDELKCHLEERDRLIQVSLQPFCNQNLD